MLPWREGRALRLAELLGRPVEAADGTTVGRVADVVVSLAEPRPRATALLIRRHRAPALAPWDTVASLGPRVVTLTREPAAGEPPREGELQLSRDVLDAQVVDLSGHRMRRVSDVELAARAGALYVLAVDTGVAAVLRRLGLGRLGRRGRPTLLEWADLHIASGRGHALQLASPAAAVHRLAPRELAALAAALPPARADDVLERAGAQPIGPAPPRRHRFPFRRGRRART